MILAAMAVVGCGSDEGSDLSEAQARAAEVAVADAAAGGVVLRESCVDDVAAGWSDDDAEAIATGNGDVSEEGSLLSIELLSCADQEALVDLFVELMQTSGQEFDEDCLRRQLGGFDIADLAAASLGGELPDDVVDAMVGCAVVDG